MDQDVPQRTACQVQGAYQLLRRAAPPADRGARGKELEIYIPPGPRLGKVVIEADNVTKAYGDNILVEGMSFMLPPGGIVGVIGPNGAGKTTLFRMITGQDKPDKGTIRIGETVKLGYVDQSRDVLDPNKTIWEVITGGQEQVQLGKLLMNSPRLCVTVQLRRHGPAEEGGRPLGRRTEPGAPRADTEGRGERAASRRAHERHRREHHAGA